MYLLGILFVVKIKNQLHSTKSVLSPGYYA